MVTVRAPRETALSFAARMTPLYAEVFKGLKADGGRLVMNSRFACMREAIGKYVTLYRNEDHLGIALLKGLLGEQEFDDFDRELANNTPEENEQILKELTEPGALEDLFDSIDLPSSEREREKAEQDFKLLSTEEQLKLARQSGLFWGGVFGQLFNTLSLMVHGVKLTALVPQAVEGDDDAFLKAVQIDRCLMTHHPYFIGRKRKAQDEGDVDFLRKLCYRESIPIVQGRIRYPALFMLFGILEATRWFDDLGREEILDLCDRAELDRYQNRIEDATYLTKRLIEYRRWRNSGGLSMH